MSVNTLRLAFAAVWLLLAGGLFTGGLRSGPSAQVGGLVAVAFALWNLARWWQARPRQVPTRQPRHPPSSEYHPEFDFNQSGDSTGSSPTR